MSNEYFVAEIPDLGREPMVYFDIFCQPVRSLRWRNKRLQLRRLSLRADLLKERCKGTGLTFQHVMQADFVLFLRARLKEGELFWSPETLLYANDFRHSAPFEVFARSRSSSY